MAIRGKKAERRSSAAILWMLPLIVSLGLGAAACGGGGSSGGAPAPAPPGLWVPNFLGFVVAFGSKPRAQSGAPEPALTNSSAAIELPEEALFDASGNLWVTSCSDPVIGAGTITQFTRKQLDSLSKDPTPNPNVTLSDNGSFDIFGCPYGEAFGSDGSLWASNRFGADLVNFTPSQLSAGGAQFPNTKIVSTDFGQLEGIQFDTNGTLWVADIVESEIFGFKAATLAAAARHDCRPRSRHHQFIGRPRRPRRRAGRAVRQSMGLELSGRHRGGICRRRRGRQRQPGSHRDAQRHDREHALRHRLEPVLSRGDGVRQARQPLGQQCAQRQ